MPTALFKKDFTPKTSDEVAELMRRKLPLPSSAWNTLKAENRARAFRIAGVNKASLVEGAQKIITNGLRDRKALRDIRLELLQLFEAEGVTAPHLNHLRVIMRQNMAHVDNVARTRVLKSPHVKRHFPYWKYVTVKDAGVRPEHAALHGRIFRADDPFWDHYKPPWGWNCRCSFVPVSERELKRLGIEPETLEDVEKEGIEPDPEFDVPRETILPVDKAMIQSFTGDLRKYVEAQIKTADELEAKLLRGEAPTPRATRRLATLTKKTAHERRADKMKALDWQDSIKRQHPSRAEAINEFTGGGYMATRHVQSGGKRASKIASGLTAEKRKEIRKKLAAMDAAYADAPKHEGTVWRGLQGLSPEKAAAIAKKGNTVTIEAWASASEVEDVAAGFASNYGDDATRAILFEIEQTQGMAVSNLSQYPKESEVLLPKGAEFEIVEVETMMATSVKGVWVEGSGMSHPLVPIGYRVKMREVIDDE